jgi:ketosteroid isomerase-like protein
MSARVDLVRDSFKAYATGDYDTLAEMMHPDLEVHDWPEAADPSVYRGLEGISQARHEWGKAWEQMDVAPTHFVEAGEHVFVVMRSTGIGRGSSIEMVTDTFGVYTFRGSKVSKVQFFIDRGSALAAAGLTEDQIRQEAT